MINLMLKQKNWFKRFLLEIFKYYWDQSKKHNQKNAPPLYWKVVRLSIIAFLVMEYAVGIMLMKTPKFMEFI